MDAAKKIERRVNRSQYLLELMTREREKVLETLGPAEGEKVLEELDALASQATRVQRGDELVALTGGVLHLVNSRPALKKALKVTSRRSANWGDINDILSGIEASEYAHQISNSVERLGQAVKEQLEKLPQHQVDNEYR